MRFTTILVAIVPLTGFAQAGCFSGGEGWDTTRPQALKVVNDDLCQTGRFSKSYNEKDASVSCVQLSGERHANFFVRRRGSGTHYLNRADCIAYFNHEINGCGYGGKSDYENWTFSADPNSGPC
ncbi:hypothetical protein G7046_g5237 [Stylonectria norvegica]|nr:hypothetical protein G7046_g5237 [Stylonectria norvegica]